VAGKSTVDGGVVRENERKLVDFPAHIGLDDWMVNSKGVTATSLE